MQEQVRPRESPREERCGLTGYVENAFSGFRENSAIDGATQRQLNYLSVFFTNVLILVGLYRKVFCIYLVLKRNI